jgi:hypothetical protein
VIIREIIVIYVPVFFIGANLQLFFKPNAKFFVKVKFLTNQVVFVLKKKFIYFKGYFSGDFSFLQS